MARGGLIVPVITGDYNVNQDMRDVLKSCRDGNHACDLAILADDVAKEINGIREEQADSSFREMRGLHRRPSYRRTMLPECRMGGIPEFSRKTLFHALNSRAIVRRSSREHGHKTNDVTVIVTHMGSDDHLPSQERQGDRHQPRPWRRRPYHS